MTTTVETHLLGEIIGNSAPICRVLELVAKAAHTDVPVLIVGETGTGKEMIARRIHTESRRAGRRFVAVNTGALPRELVASELFGHRKGSFTGASSDKLGRFREADGGTLFLDEIGTMDDLVQVSLLRALETERIRPVGDTTDHQVDVRLIAATNEDPWQLAEVGQFRDDLLYRLEVMRIDLPPLRAVREDIPQLVDHFLAMFAAQFEMPIDGLDAEALEALVKYEWPGNVRELKNVIAQACVVAERGDIGIEHLPARWRKSRSEAAESAAAHGTFTSDGTEHPRERASRSPQLRTDVDSGRAGFTDGVFVPLGVTLEEVQKEYALKTLQSCDNNKTKTARILGVSRKTLYDRLKRWGCD
jgi:DNA-binding NtrC family response regulator